MIPIVETNFYTFPYELDYKSVSYCNRFYFIVIFVLILSPTCQITIRNALLFFLCLYLLYFKHFLTFYNATKCHRVYDF